ncbi:protein unzipped [Nasonia vitripennis]|uniref:Protein unzipped n=1 Tax=Nasonia vitripennis TaxID=7425 RepID=A0A7M7QVR6_NASVI|nr:protein unzipped [Nasonia vitripennis]XP_032453532.1 protein unzipped [Nasonia vitripennis]XP_032453533.1 protein unzipped [Nasonia vitripennis]
MKLLALCLSSALLLLVGAQTSVHILSKYGNGQLITSSILAWIPHTQYSASKTLVIGGFEVVSGSAAESSEPRDKQGRPIFVCRAMHNGNWVAGGQKQGDKHCNVSLTGSVGSYERYQLLENVDKAARINWENWTKLYQTPVGAVATSKFFVARHAVHMGKSENGQDLLHNYIGTLDSQDSLGAIYYVKEDGTEGTADNGQVLVETEPIMYELNAVKLNQQRKVLAKREERILGQATIKNEASSPGMMAEAFSYSYLYTLYWGQGHAMIKGLNTTVSLLNKTRLNDVDWGIPIKENRTNVHTVEIYLEPGTAVNVTLRGYYTDAELPYSGKLHSHYKDGVMLNTRTISDVRHEATLTDIAPEFGPIYFLGNDSLVPTTVPPPTTEPTTTPASTTLRLTTMPPTRQQQPTDRFDINDSTAEEQQYSKESAALDENAILAKHGMQGDDGGPLSLKDKDAGHSAAGPRSALLATTALFALLLHRVT